MDIDFHLIGNNNRAQYRKKNIKFYEKSAFFAVVFSFSLLLGTIHLSVL